MPARAGRVLPRRWLIRQVRRRLRLSRYWQSTGDLDQAAGDAERAQRLLDRAGAGPTELATEVALTLAAIARDRDDPAGSLDWLRSALARLDPAPPAADRDRLLARTLIALGDCHRRAARYPQAGEALDRALRLLDPAGGDPPAPPESPSGPPEPRSGPPEPRSGPPEPRSGPPEPRSGPPEPRSGPPEPPAGPVWPPAGVAGLLAEALTVRGIIAKELGEYERAERCYARVRQLFGERPAAADAATLAHNLAGLAHARGRYPEAEAHARHAVALRPRSRGTAVELAADLAVLGATLAGQGRYAEARELFEQAMAACQVARPPRRYEIAVHLHSLAAIDQAAGRPADAERRYRQALALKEELLGPNHPEIALVANNLAGLLAEQQRLADARQWYDRALAVATAAYPAGHPVPTRVRHNLDRLAAAPEPLAATEPPAAEPPAAEPPVTEAPAAVPLAAGLPVTELPAAAPPVTEAPVSEAPAAEPPAAGGQRVDEPPAGAANAECC